MSFGTDFITKPLQEKIDCLLEENKELKQENMTLGYISKAFDKKIWKLEQENKQLKQRNESLIVQHNQIREAHIKDIKKIEAIRTGLLELIEHGYIKHCVTDVMNLLDESDNPKKQNEKTVS